MFCREIDSDTYPPLLFPPDSCLVWLSAPLDGVRLPRLLGGGGREIGRYRGYQNKLFNRKNPKSFLPREGVPETWRS